MEIFLNEKRVLVPDGFTLSQLRKGFDPEADVAVINGHPAEGDPVLEEGSRVVLIKRGRMPSPEEFEALLTARHTPGVHEKVRKAAVGIAGLGGLGSAVAVALARTGVGKLVIADFDMVEPSNLNRQHYFPDQIGLPKTEALTETLKRLNPCIEVVAHTVRLTRENIPRIFSQVDVMVEAFDHAEEKAMLTETFLGAFPETPLVAASGVAGFAPSNTIVTRRVMRNLFVVGDGESEARPGQGLMAPRVGIAAHHQANAVLRLLLGLEPT